MYPPLPIVMYVEVALRESVDEPMYRLPPADLKKKCLAFVPADGSVKTNWGLVEEAIWSSQLGVDVPTPMLPIELITIFSVIVPP
jgi:hypothetical protein